MKKAPRAFSNTLDASKAATFYDRMHALKDALEALQAQYTADLAELVEEASESLSVDPGLFRMAFTAERQKRKREAKIAKMEGYKAVQLDLLGDAACGSDGLSRRRPVAPKLVEKIAQAVQTPAGQKALLTAVDVMIGREESQAKAVDEAHAVGADRAEGKPEAPNGVETVSRGADARSSAATSEIMDATSRERPAPTKPLDEIPAFLDRRNRPQKLAVA